MIICAAIKVRFVRADKIIEVVIPGLRHGHIWELMADLGVPAKREEIEGFIDHTGAFLDRYEALAHALVCGQLSDTVRTEKVEKREITLWSEDLY